MQDTADMLDFFVWLDQRSSQLLHRWPGDFLFLDTGARSLEELATTVVESMDV